MRNCVELPDPKLRPWSASTGTHLAYARPATVRSRPPGLASAAIARSSRPTIGRNDTRLERVASRTLIWRSVQRLQLAQDGRNELRNCGMDMHRPLQDRIGHL